MSDTVLRVMHLVSAEVDWEPFTGIVSMCAALREHGVTSVITAPEHSRLWEVAEAAGVETVDHALTATINPFRWKELGNLVKAQAATIVHAHDVGAATALSRSRYFGTGTGVAVTRYDVRTQPSAAEYGGGVDAVICPSEALAKIFVEKGAPLEKVHVVYNGLNVAAVERAVEERDVVRGSIRDMYCPKKDKPRFIISVAPFDGANGQGELIEAMPEVLAAVPQAHLLLMGEGAGGEELARLARSHAVSGDVSFLEPDKAFVRLLAGADLYVAGGSADYSGFMVEAAMMVGRGVVAREGGCHGELLDGGRCGVLVSGDEGLGGAVLAMMRDRRRREGFGGVARGWAVREFSASVQAGRIAEVYRSICPG